MSISSKQPVLLRVLGGVRVDPPPVWLMRQAGRYLAEYRALRAKAEGFLDFCYRPELAVEATLQPLRRFDFDAAILFSDILVVADALGVKLEFREGEGPWLERVTAGTVSRLKLDNVRRHLAPVYETVQRLRSRLDRGKALIGFAGGPWTVACYMAEGSGSRNFAMAKAWMWRDRSGFDALMDVLVEATGEHLAAQIEAGVDCVQIFDSWAGVLPEAEFERYCIAPTARIASKLRARFPGCRIIGFPRGGGALVLAYARRADVDAVGLDQSTPRALAQEVQRLLPVQGYLDPILLATGGEAMRARIREIIEACSGGPHIFNLGHGIVPETPVEHVAELVRAVKECV